MRPLHRRWAMKTAVEIVCAMSLFSGYIAGRAVWFGVGRLVSPREVAR